MNPWIERLLADPDNDELRIAYAESGEPSQLVADLIRAQVEYERAQSEGIQDSTLASTVGQLHAQLHDELTLRFSELGVSRFYIDHRGFVTSIMTSTEVYASHADSLFSLAPLLRAVSLDNSSSELAPATMVPQNEQLRSLKVEGGMDSKDVKSLFHAEPLRFVEQLWLRSNGIGDGLLRVRDCCLEKLLQLDLRDNALTADSIVRFVKSQPLRTLTQLHLGGNPLGEEGAALISQAIFLNSLQRIDLDGCDLGDKAVRLLSPLVAKRLKLRLIENGFTETGVAALFHANVSNLTELDCSGNPLTSNGFHEIVTTSFPFLEALYLCEINILSGVEILHGAVDGWSGFSNAPMLRVLDVSHNELRNDLLAMICRISTLAELNLDGCWGITDEGLEDLAKAPFDLKRLDLVGVGMSESTYSKLAARYGEEVAVWDNP